MSGENIYISAISGPWSGVYSVDWRPGPGHQVFHQRLDDALVVVLEVLVVGLVRIVSWA